MQTSRSDHVDDLLRDSAHINERFGNEAINEAGQYEIVKLFTVL